MRFVIDVPPSPRKGNLALAAALVLIERATRTDDETVREALLADAGRRLTEAYS